MGQVSTSARPDPREAPTYTLAEAAYYLAIPVATQLLIYVFVSEIESTAHEVFAFSAKHLARLSEKCVVGWRHRVHDLSAPRQHHHTTGAACQRHWMPLVELGGFFSPGNRTMQLD